MQLIHDIVEWVTELLLPLGPFGLFILAFTEAFFNPIPVETLLIPFCLEYKSYWLFYVFLAWIGSVIGGCFGYALGYLGEEKIVSRFFSAKKIEKVHKYYEKYGVLTIFIAGFGPIPYKIVAVSAGLFYVNFKKFFVVSVISRGLRFLIIGYLTVLMGSYVIEFIDKYLFWMILIFCLILIVAFLIYDKYYRKKKSFLKNKKRRITDKST
jgi:membrane protein YqaA with SNARE-associated domain